jgi:hypothetical protein
MGSMLQSNNGLGNWRSQQDSSVGLLQKSENVTFSGKKVTWVDKYGNKHDLDFVLD